MEFDSEFVALEWSTFSKFKLVLQILNVFCICLVCTALSLSVRRLHLNYRNKKSDGTDNTIFVYYVSAFLLVVSVTIGLRLPYQRGSKESDEMCTFAAKGITVSYVLSHMALYRFYFLRTKLTQGLVSKVKWLNHLRYAVNIATFISPLFAIVAGVITSGWVIGEPAAPLGEAWCWLRIDPTLGILFLISDTGLCLGYTLVFVLPMTIMEIGTLDSGAQALSSENQSEEAPVKATALTRKKKLHKIAKTNAWLALVHLFASIFGLCTTAIALVSLDGARQDEGLERIANETAKGILLNSTNPDDVNELIWPLMPPDQIMATSELFMFFADGVIFPLLPFFMKKSWYPKVSCSRRTGIQLGEDIKVGPTGTQFVGKESSAVAISDYDSQQSEFCRPKSRYSMDKVHSRMDCIHSEVVEDSS